MPNTARTVIHAFDNPASAAKCELAIGRVMHSMCEREGHTPSLIRVRKSGSSTIPIDRDIRGEILRILSEGPKKYHAICAGIDAPNGAVRQTLAGMKKTGELLANYPALKNHGAIWSLNPRQPGVSAPTASEHEKGAVRRNHSSNGSEPRQHAPLASPGQGRTGGGMKKLKVLDLFSGIGGFSLGLERTGGFETVAFCEIEEFPRKVLAKHWPGVPIYHDVRKLKGSEIGAVDVICGGFPCQDISTSGAGAGIDGERSGLWREFARLIGEIRPAFVIVENSPNLVSGGDGRWMGRVLSDLASLGYDAEWHVIPLSATGAPHKRERVWIIAYPAGIGQSRQGQLLNAICAAPDAYREASWLVDAFRKDALPFMCGRHDGISPRLAQPRLTALGNAVGPAMAENLGRAILEAAQ